MVNTAASKNHTYRGKTTIGLSRAFQCAPRSMSHATLSHVVAWRDVEERPVVSHLRVWGPVCADAAALLLEREVCATCGHIERVTKE